MRTPTLEDYRSFFYRNAAVARGGRAKNVAALAARARRVAREPFGMSRTYHHFDIDRDRAPFRMDFAEVHPGRAAQIEDAGKIVFHMVGDTGSHSSGAQNNVAQHMAEQIRTIPMPDQPSFLFHLGDIVYSFGEEKYYLDEFYKPYTPYQAPILGVPGNHDGYIIQSSPRSLDAFRRHFCSRTPTITQAAKDADPVHPRPSMTQPNAYFRLNAPFVTIVGLYSNTGGSLDDEPSGSTEQRDWLARELKDAPKSKPLLIAVHHPPFTRGNHGNSTVVHKAIEQACADAKRLPDAIFSGHEHNYQRFTRTVGKKEIPYVVAGNGGHEGYDGDFVNRDVRLPAGVRADGIQDTQPGFLRVSIDRAEMRCEYHVIPDAKNKHNPTTVFDPFVLDLRKSKVTNLPVP
jgi:hypothetical protein